MSTQRLANPSLAGRSAHLPPSGKLARFDSLGICSSALDDDTIQAALQIPGFGLADVTVIPVASGEIGDAETEHQIIATTDSSTAGITDRALTALRDKVRVLTADNAAKDQRIKVLEGQLAAKAAKATPAPKPAAAPAPPDATTTEVAKPETPALPAAPSKPVATSARAKKDAPAGTEGEASTPSETTTAVISADAVQPGDIRTDDTETSTQGDSATPSTDTASVPEDAKPNGETGN